MLSQTDRPMDEARSPPSLFQIVALFLWLWWSLYFLIKLRLWGKLCSSKLEIHSFSILFKNIFKTKFSQLL